MLNIEITHEVREQVYDAVGADLGKWWIDEYKKRAHVELAEALEEMLEVSIENFKAEHRPLEGVGQCMFRIGAKLNAWLHAYCPNYVYDEAFIKQLIADNQHLCFKPTYLHKAQIIKPEMQNSEPPKGGTTIPQAA